jgi:hypothetical protein
MTKIKKVDMSGRIPVNDGTPDDYDGDPFLRMLGEALDADHEDGVTESTHDGSDEIVEEKPTRPIRRYA